MSESVSADRARASRLGKWFVEQNQPDAAVQVLTAWAVQGPNDREGQELLAEALRINPKAPEASMAFERMEKLPGVHKALEAAVAHYTSAEIARLEGEIHKPTFRRAQMGFNNNLRTGGQTFHVQTEDSGLDNPHIVTHLFADGGRVIRSHKRSYSDAVGREADVGAFVRQLMKAQHMEMVLALRDGQFAGIIEGRERGGLLTLSEPPREDVLRRVTHGKRSDAKERASMRPAAPRKEALFSLAVVRGSSGREAYEVFTESAVLGTRGSIAIEGERFCCAEEAVVTYRDGQLFVEDLEGGNGVFVRVRNPVALEMGDEFIVGDQLLRVDRNPVPDDGPDSAPTYFYSSPKWPSTFRVMQILQGGAVGACSVAHGNTLQIGSVIGDLVFVDDPLVEQQHCVVEEQAGVIVLSDLGSSTGLFVRIHGEYELHDADELLVGRTRLRAVVRDPQNKETPPKSTKGRAAKTKS